MTRASPATIDPKRGKELVRLAQAARRETRPSRGPDQRNDAPDPSCRELSAVASPWG